MGTVVVFVNVIVAIAVLVVLVVDVVVEVVVLQRTLLAVTDVNWTYSEIEDQEMIRRTHEHNGL